MSELTVRLTRLSATRHRLEAIGPDGARVTRDLETRSLLLHDLVHFALESEAGLRRSFFGALARGGAYDATLQGEEAMETEKIVGPLQGAVKNGAAPDDFLARYLEYRRSIGETAPAWLTQDLVLRVFDHVRRLQGRWRATPVHGVMELHFAL